MTRDEILNMPAGREMDALIAERVMGWTDIYYFKQEDTGPQSDCANGFDGEYYSAIPCYSTDIAAAWQIVEKVTSLQQPCPYFDLARMGEYYCNFGEYGATAETAPLAICRAALLAVTEGDK